VAEAQAAAMMAEEFALTRGVDAVVAVTETEAALLQEGQAAPFVVLSHPVRPRCEPKFGERSGFLFVSELLERESPNYDGLRWFVREVWPGIRRDLGEASLTVVGAVCAEHDDLAGSWVRLLGPQRGLIPFYDATRVFVAPARFAAGGPGESAGGG